MLNSRDISLLRADVAANCRMWIDMCKAAGLNVLVVSTVRDDAYQAHLYEQGRTRPGAIVTNSKTPTFHWDKAGLAFDFCKNVRGQEYTDTAFFAKAAAIAKKMGFIWGGDWESFVDRPHIQWEGTGADKVTGAQIRAGKLPPIMPLYKGEDEEVIDTMKVLYNGKEVEINRIHKDGYNFIKIQDLRLLGLSVGYDETNKIPVIARDD